MEAGGPLDHLTKSVCLGFRVLGFRVEGLRFRVEGLGLRVWVGFGLLACCRLRELQEAMAAFKRTPRSLKNIGDGSLNRHCELKPAEAHVFKTAKPLPHSTLYPKPETIFPG